MELKEFYTNKKILVTGHTGFKGSWLCKVLSLMGANVVGYALDAPTKPALFTLCGVEREIKSIRGDIRNLEYLLKVMKEERPEIVIHMAAQPIARVSYNQPVYTYETNVMGTVNILEGIRQTESVKSFLNVTTDKVYLNREWEWGYRENEELNGYDPYSNSKSCSELVTSCYQKSYFNSIHENARRTAISTSRAGNVIGGGDFASDRIIPDCVRAINSNADIVIRNPYSIRPYQHVLEPIMAYLLIAAKQYEDIKYAGAYNIGPNEEDCITTGEIATLFCEKWRLLTGRKLGWISQYDGGPHESVFLKLDCSKIKNTLEWKPCWGIEAAIEKAVEWTKAYYEGMSVEKCMMKQIGEYLIQCQRQGWIKQM